MKYNPVEILKAANVLKQKLEGLRSDFEFMKSQLLELEGWLDINCSVLEPYNLCDNCLLIINKYLNDENKI